MKRNNLERQKQEKQNSWQWEKHAKAIVWPTPGLKETTLDSSGPSAEATIISASMVTH